MIELERKKKEKEIQQQKNKKNNSQKPKSFQYIPKKRVNDANEHKKAYIKQSEAKILQN